MIFLKLEFEHCHLDIIPYKNKSKYYLKYLYFILPHYLSPVGHFVFYFCKIWNGLCLSETLQFVLYSWSRYFAFFFELCKYHKICVPSLMIHLCPMFDDTFRIAKNDQF